MRCFLVGCFLLLASAACGFSADTYPPADSLKDVYSSADAVFIGEIQDIQVSKRYFFVFPAEYTLTLSLKKAWKGVGLEKVVLETGSRRADCGSSLTKGESYLVFVNDQAVQIKHLTRAADELDYLNSLYLRLPRPFGPHAIGTKNFYFVDSTRPESFTPDPDDHREVAFRVWYPALLPKESRPVSLIENPQELGRIYASYSPLPPTALDALSSVETYSYRDADILRSTEPFPILLFSHAYWAGMTQSTVLMEELASYGYIVVSIGHAYETSHFPREDGSIKAFDPRNEEFRLRGLERKNTLDIQRRISETEDRQELETLLRELSKLRPKTIESLHIWADDISFVIDKLEEMNRGSGFFGGKLDTARIGVLGHSFGGAASAQVCLTDKRCKAGINIDGLQLGDLIYKNLTRPFMFVHHDNVEVKNRTPNQFFFDRVENTAYLLLIKGTRHLNFSDISIPGYASILGLPPEALGRINGRRCLDIQNRYVLAFFDKHLKEMDSGLLNSPTPEYPEVEIWTREQEGN